MLRDNCKSRLYFGVHMELTGQNMAKYKRGLLLSGSDMQKGSFFNLVSSEYFSESITLPVEYWNVLLLQLTVWLEFPRGTHLHYKMDWGDGYSEVLDTQFANHMYDRPGNHFYHSITPLSVNYSIEEYSTINTWNWNSQEYFLRNFKWIELNVWTIFSSFLTFSVIHLLV